MTATHIRSPGRALPLLASHVVLVSALLSTPGVAACGRPVDSGHDQGARRSTAHADRANVDAGFRAALSSHGIMYSSPEVAVVAAHLVCTKIDGGETPTQVAQEVLNYSRLDTYHAGYFVGASIAVYCPQHTGKT
jgi:hypothetical protein